MMDKLLEDVGLWLERKITDTSLLQRWQKFNIMDKVQFQRSQLSVH